MSNIDDELEQLAKNDPWVRVQINFLKNKWGNPLPELIKKGFLQNQKKRFGPQKQIINWVGNLSYVGDQIESGSLNRSEHAIFWIRLYEVIGYLPKYLSLAGDLGLAIKSGAIAENLIKTFNDDEFTMIEFQRNFHAHIHQNSYKIKAKLVKGKLVDDGMYRDGVDKLEIDRLLDRELSKYKNDDKIMALAYYQKSKILIEKLWAELKNELTT
jgi:hypothetical protein